MNNKFFLLLICLAIITTSCRKELTFGTVTTSSNELSICNNATCPEIDIEYVQVSGTTETAQIINESIEEFVKQSMYLGENETGSSAENITQAMTEFVEIYRLHSAEFPDLTAEYFVEITVLSSYNSKELLSLSCRNYLYAGGAHGNAPDHRGAAHGASARSRGPTRWEIPFIQSTSFAKAYEAWPSCWAASPISSVKAAGASMVAAGAAAMGAACLRGGPGAEPVLLRARRAANAAAPLDHRSAAHGASARVCWLTRWQIPSFQSNSSAKAYEASPSC